MFLKQIITNKKGEVASIALVVGMIIVTLGVLAGGQALNKQRTQTSSQAALIDTVTVTSEVITKGVPTKPWQSGTTCPATFPSAPNMKFNVAAIDGASAMQSSDYRFCDNTNGGKPFAVIQSTRSVLSRMTLSGVPAGYSCVSWEHHQTKVDDPTIKRLVSTGNGCNITEGLAGDVDAAWTHDFRFIIEPTQVTVTLNANVYLDTNRNNVQDSGEAGHSGATISVTQAPGTYTTSGVANPTIIFPSLPVGSYNVKITPQSGYQATGQETVVVTYPSGTVSQNVSFGVAPAPTVTPTPRPVRITSQVFIDTNRNGTFESTETIYSGAMISIVGVAPITHTANAIANPAAIFDGIPAGTYNVTLDVPVGYISTGSTTRQVSFPDGVSAHSIPFGIVSSTAATNTPVPTSLTPTVPPCDAVPEIPTGLTVEASGLTPATVKEYAKWSVARGATSYSIRIDANADSWAPIPTCSTPGMNADDVCVDGIVPANSSGIVTYDHTFKPGVKYHIWVHGVNACGTGTAATYTFTKPGVTTPPACVAPSLPTNFAATRTTDLSTKRETFTFTWTPPANTSGIAFYTIEKRSFANGAYSAWTTLSTNFKTSGESTYFTYMAAVTDYQFRIQSVGNCSTPPLRSVFSDIITVPPVGSEVTSTPVPTTDTSGKADVIITAATPVFNTAKNLTVKSTIKNAGSGAVNHTGTHETKVEIKDGSTVVCSANVLQSINKLAAQGTKDFEIYFPTNVYGSCPTFTPTDGKEYTVVLTADTTNAIAESNESNNSFTLKFTQGSTASTPTPTVDIANCPKRPQGDATCEGIIDSLDYVCWKSEFVDKVKPKGCVTSDFNSRDGIDILDFTIWSVTKKSQ